MGCPHAQLHHSDWRMYLLAYQVSHLDANLDDFLPGRVDVDEGNQSTDRWLSKRNANAHDDQRWICSGNIEFLLLLLRCNRAPFPHRVEDTALCPAEGAGR